jgi:hypothetical protein
VGGSFSTAAGGSSLAIGRFTLGDSLAVASCIPEVQGDPSGGPVLVAPRATGLMVTPNPAIRLVTLRVELPVEQHVLLDIYDLNGRLVDRVAHGVMSAGVHSLRWSPLDKGSRVASGIYFVRMTTKTGERTARVLLIP